MPKVFLDGVEQKSPIQINLRDLWQVRIADPTTGRIAVMFNCPEYPDTKVQLEFSIMGAIGDLVTMTNTALKADKPDPTKGGVIHCIWNDGDIAWSVVPALTEPLGGAGAG